MSESTTSAHCRSLRSALLLSRGAHRRPRSYSRGRVGFGALAVSSLCFLTVAAFGTGAAVAATTTVNLGSASTFAVLAGSTITNTGSSVISGNIGLYPGTSITGIPPLVQSSGVVDRTNDTALLAENDTTTAYLDAAGRTPFTTVAADLGGTTLTPGVYASSTSMALTGAVTLNGEGDADAVFIFQIGSTLTTASGSSVVLENGAQACNVFWQVGTSATLGTTTSFAGTILTLSSATLNTGATVNGRILARNGAVTLDDSLITVPTCSAAAATTTTRSTTSSTTRSPTSSTTSSTISSTTSSTTSPTTSTVPVATTTSSVVPIGSPQTGFGGTAGSGFSPRGLIGWIALSLAVGAATMAVWTRRRSVNGRG